MNDLNQSCENEKFRRELQLKVKPSIIKLLDEAMEFLDLVKRDTNVEAVAEYKHFKASQIFGKAEIASEDEQEALTSESLKTAQDASDFARENLNPAHPVRLDIELSLSEVYKYLLKEDKYLINSDDKALAVAKEAYDKGSSRLSELEESLSGDAVDRLEELKGRIDEWSEIQ